MVTLVATKLPILPEPLAANPMELLLFVQLKIVPGTEPMKFTGAVLDPLHNTWLGIGLTVGVGSTVTVAVIDGPTQPLAVGVMVKTVVCITPTALVSVPEILPVPLAGMPVSVMVLSLVQLYTVPATLPLSTMVVIVELLQIVCDAGVATAFGVGLTNTVAVILGPVHVTPALVKVGVIVNVTVTGAKVVLVSVPDILPVPLAAIPVTVATLSLTQLYTVPATLPVSTIVVIGTPEHTVCDEGVATAFGIGFTTIVAVVVGPTQPLAVGVMVKVTVCGALVRLFNTAAGTLPAPAGGRPVTFTLLSLTHA